MRQPQMNQFGNQMGMQYGMQQQRYYAMQHQPSYNNGGAYGHGYSNPVHGHQGNNYQHQRHYNYSYNNGGGAQRQQQYGYGYGYGGGMRRQYNDRQPQMNANQHRMPRQFSSRQPQMNSNQYGMQPQMYQHGMRRQQQQSFGIMDRRQSDVRIDFYETTCHEDKRSIAATTTATTSTTTDKARKECG